jgi:hypothetical protein
MGLFDSAKRDLEQGMEPEQVETKYESEIEELNEDAEKAFQIEDQTPLDMIQSKIYQKQRWFKIVQNHDRGSTSNREHSMFTDTVRDDIRSSENDLEKMKASYLPFKEVLDNIEYVKNNFPDILEQDQEGRRDPQFTDSELEEYLHDRDE